MKKITCKTTITVTSTFIRISSIENEIVIATDSIIGTTERIRTVFTAWITFALQSNDVAFKLQTIQTITLLILWTRIMLTRVNRKINYNNSHTTNYSL